MHRRIRDWRVELAYLDDLQPSLAELGERLVDGGITCAVVVPVFLSPGGNHIIRDIPALVAEVTRAQPQLQLELLSGAFGAEREVLDALADATVRFTARTR